MNEVETTYLRDEVGEVEPSLVVGSRTKIEAGRWWLSTRVWLCVMADELVMFSVSRRRYIARVSLAGCPQSHYCHASGELVIEPGEDLMFNRFRMSPRKALTLLENLTLKRIEQEN